MKLKNIKTKDELNQVADIWYNRTINLRHVWQNENEESERRIKAYLLWGTMRDRIIQLLPLILRLSVPPSTKGYKPGGVVAKEHYLK